VNFNEIAVHWAGVDGKTEEPSNLPTSIDDSDEDGLQGVIVDLYECNFHTWVKGTRTLLDGSYFLSQIPPGTYSFQLTALNGYHFVFDLNNNNWRNKELDHSMVTSPCFELQPLQDNTHMTLGLWPMILFQLFSRIVLRR
jgi:hypothetical protein